MFHHHPWQEVSGRGGEFSWALHLRMRFTIILFLKWNRGDLTKQPVLFWGHSLSGDPRCLHSHTPVHSPNSKADTAWESFRLRQLDDGWRTYPPPFKMMFFWEFNAQKSDRHSPVLVEFRSHHNLLEDRCIFILDSSNSIILAFHYQDCLRLILSTHVLALDAIQEYSINAIEYLFCLKWNLHKVKYTVQSV